VKRHFHLPTHEAQLIIRKVQWSCPLPPYRC